MSSSASIVVPCCNQLNFTRLCLESVLRHTTSPYELIVIDNASTDGTPAYLHSLPARPGPQSVEVITCSGNLGHPAACNRGLARARGEAVAFLDNDIVLTPGWLEALLLHLYDRGLKTGLVGPVSNSAAGRQQVAPGYTDLDGLDTFALTHRLRKGPARPCRRLSGFCLLGRRTLLEQLGGFDERFTPGYFGDDDLCLRTQDAGHGLALANDVYIHHFGGRTFAGLGLDAQGL